MPVQKQKWIERSDLQANPAWRYIFGDNEIRRGLGGQAASMRGEPNAIGVATLYAPGHPWSDTQFDHCAAVVLADLLPAWSHLAKGGTLVVPEDGVGTGLARLRESAPRLFAFVQAQMAALDSVDFADAQVSA